MPFFAYFLIPPPGCLSAPFAAGRVIEVDGLQIGELIYGYGPASSPVSAGFGPAERQVDLRTNSGSIDIGDACIYPFYRPKSIFDMNQNGP